MLGVEIDGPVAAGYQSGGWGGLSSARNGVHPEFDRVGLIVHLDDQQVVQGVGRARHPDPCLVAARRVGNPHLSIGTREHAPAAVDATEQETVAILQLVTEASGVGAVGVDEHTHVERAAAVGRGHRAVI